MDHLAALLSEIEAYTQARGITESTFGRLAVNDGKFVARLRAGGSMTFATAGRVRAFIKENPPRVAAAGPSPKAA